MEAGRRRSAIIASFCFAFAIPCLAHAADYPSKPVVLVVPQGTGSGSDVIARLLATRMAQTLGQTVVVENRTGAGGIIAHQSVVRAPADGYTILLTSTAQLIVVPAINRSAKYSLDDLAAVAPVLRAPFAVLVANTAAAPKSLQALIEALREKPGAYASAGIGTMTHLGSEVFLSRAGVKATHVPYKGSGAALTDLMGGQVLFATDSLTASMPHLRSGRLRALAVTGDARESSLPDVPTLAEVGLPGQPVAVIGGLFAPKGIPEEVTRRLQQAVGEALRSPDLLARFKDSETSVLEMSTDAFVGQLRQEAPLWEKLVRELDLKAD